MIDLLLNPEELFKTLIKKRRKKANSDRKLRRGLSYIVLTSSILMLKCVSFELQLACFADSTAQHSTVSKGNLHCYVQHS